MKIVVFCLLIVLCCFNAADARQSGYKVIGQVRLGGDGGWDYLNADTTTGRLFISRGSHVQVMDMQKRTLAGDIPNTSGVHGIALAHEFHKGYISDGRDTAVTVFDIATLKTLRVVKIKGLNPDAIMYEPVSKRILTFNGRSNDATAIDAATDSVVGTIALGGKPEFPQADGHGNVYVNIEDKSTITGFNASTLKTIKTWPIAPGEEASGLAIDRARHLLFSVAGNKLMVISDYEAGKVVATDSIGEGPDGAAYDSDRSLAFSSNGRDGTITVVRVDAPGSSTVLENVKTQRGARTISLDPKSHLLYLPTAEFGKAPEPTAENPRPRPQMVPGSFTILIVGR
jgi:YVTN family beta-propeller protein